MRPRRQHEPTPLGNYGQRRQTPTIAAAITIEVLPAAYGDAIWIECARDGRPWRLLVDGGPPEAADVVKARLDALPPDDRVLDVVVVSHIDSDHIGGMLPLLARDDVEVGDVWFNALQQLPQADEQLTRSVAEGEDLVRLLAGVGRSRPLPWNRVTDGRAIATPGDRTFVELTLPAGAPRIMLLSPTPKRLRALRRVWDAALAKALRGESEEEEPAAPPEPLGDLKALATTQTANDTAAPNGSSIAFLLEHRGASCLLGADAWPTVLGGALWALANARGGRPVPVDAVKLPHHGSQKNVSAALLTTVSSDTFLISTNGEHFGHPDDIALARAVGAGGPGTTLRFNYPPTGKTRRWADRELRRRCEFTTEFAEPGRGTRVELEERP